LMVGSSVEPGSFDFEPATGIAEGKAWWRTVVAMVGDEVNVVDLFYQKYIKVRYMKLE